MRLRKYAMWTLLLFCAVLTSCVMFRPVSEVPRDGKSPSQGETVLTVGAYSLLEDSGIFTVSSATEYGETTYEAYHTLRYFDGAGKIADNYILVSKTADGRYTLSSLRESGVTAYGQTYAAYAFHGDYVILDGEVYSGALVPLGAAYGDVTGVTPLEDGGIITFAAQDSGAVYSYFHAEATEIPDYSTNYRAFPYAQTSRGLLTNDNRYAVSHEANLYLYTNGVCYRTPIPEYTTAEDRLSERIEATLFGEEGTFYFYRLYYASPQKDVRFLEIHHLNHAEAPGYFRMTEVPIDAHDEAEWLSMQGRAYEKSTCAFFPEITWFEDANANYFGYLGTLEKTSENQLRQTLPDGTQKYYNENLTLISQSGESTEYGKARYTWEVKDASAQKGVSETVSITVPSTWTRYGSVFDEHLAYDTHCAKKRMEIQQRAGLTEKAWISELDDGVYDKTGPYTGVTPTGHPYTYYFKEPQIEKDVNWRIYYFYILSDSSIPYTVTMHVNLDYDVADTLETVILPAIDSMVIGADETGENATPASVFDPNA